MDDRGERSLMCDLDGLRERRPEAVREWFSSYFAVVHGFVCRRVACCPDLAEDVTQDTFLVALRQIRDFDPERGAMLPWLTYIARNCARKALRQAGRESATPQDGAVGAGTFPDLAVAPLPEELLDRGETADRVHAALSALAPRHQRVLESHYLLDRPLAQIASTEGSTVAATKSLLHRARIAFKAAFEAAGDTGEREAAPRGWTVRRATDTMEGIHGRE